MSKFLLLNFAPSLWQHDEERGKEEEEGQLAESYIPFVHLLLDAKSPPSTQQLV